MIAILAEAKTLLYAPVLNRGLLRDRPPDLYVIRRRASYAGETASMTDALLGEGGLKLEDIGHQLQVPQ